MKKNLKYLLPALLIFWSAIVMYFYHENHFYFYLVNKIWSEQGIKTFAYYLPVFILYLGYVFYKKFIDEKKEGEFSVSVFSLFLTTTIVFIIHSTFLFFLWQPAIYTGSPLVYDKEKNVTRELTAEDKGNSNISVVLNTGLLTFDEALTEKVKKAGLANKFKAPSSVDAVLYLGKNYLNSVLPLFLTSILAYILGFSFSCFFSKLKTLFLEKRKEEENSALALSENGSSLIRSLSLLGLGYIFLICLSFVLGFFGVLNTLSIRISALLILLLAIFQAKTFYQKFTHSLKLKFKFFSLEVFLTLLLIISFVHVILGSFHDVPVGIDGARLYVKIVRDILVGSSLPSGFPPFNANLIHSFASLLTYGNIQSMMLMPFFHALLSFVLVYLLGRRYLKIENRPLLLTTMVMGFSAMTLFLTILDHKTEFFALFFCLLSIYYFLDWLNLSKEEKSSKFGFSASLLVSAIFLGIALGAKMTFLSVFVGLIAFLIFRLWPGIGWLPAFLSVIFTVSITGTLKFPGLTLSKEAKYYLAGILLLILAFFFAFQISKYRFKALKKLILIASFAALALAPLLPWGALHYSEFPSNVKPSLTGLLNGYKPKLNVVKVREGLQCDNNIGFETDYGRYVSQSENISDVLISYLTLPWEMTVNTLNPNSNTTDIGFVLLALLPIALLLGFFKKIKSKNFRAILLVTIFSWLFWLLTFPGVTWYALGSLYLTYLLLASLWPKKEDKILYILFVFISVIYIIQMHFFSIHRIERIYLAIGTNTLEHGRFFEMSFPNYRNIIDTARNEDYFLNNKKIIVKGGGSLEYFLLRGEEFILHDNYMEFVNCVLDKHNGNGLAAVQDMYDRGVKYIFLSKSMFTDRREKARNNYVRAYKSISPYLKKLTEGDRIYFGEIPDGIKDVKPEDLQLAGSEVKEE